MAGYSPVGARLNQAAPAHEDVLHRRRALAQHPPVGGNAFLRKTFLADLARRTGHLKRGYGMRRSRLNPHARCMTSVRWTLS